MKKINILKNSRDFYRIIKLADNDNEITKACRVEAEGKVILFSSKEKLEDGVI